MRDYVISDHATFEMRRRGLGDEIVRAVLDEPEQQLPVRPGRIILQSRVHLGQPARTYLVRVVVDVDRRPPEVVTAYRTRKLAKYWRPQP